MNLQTDSQLLRAYAELRSEPAFAELVHRHVDLVHSAALRMVRDPHLAQDVTQGVFVALANNAAQLNDRPVLSGWLHRTAQNIASQTVRTIERRRAREQEAAAMNALMSDQPEAVWQQVAPLLDAALGELSEPDRDALLLRYFERKSAREMAQTLGVSDEAAQKRVSRAVERLREFFAKHGVTVGASGLVLSLTANAVQAAPAGLAAAVCTAAALASNSLATAASSTAAKTIAMTTLQKTLVTATVTLLAAVGLYETRQAAQLREQLTVLRQERAPSSAHDPAALLAKVDALAASNAGLSTALARATADKGRLEAEHQQARHSAALFKELAEQAATKDKNRTNAYPTVRHAWVAIGKLARLAAQSTEEDSNLTADEKAAIKAARSNIFEEFGSILKAIQHLDEESPAGAEPAKDDSADLITCLLFGALGLNESQFGAVYNLVQKYQQQAKQLAPDGKPPGSEMAVEFKQLLEAGKTELQAVLTPEQAAIFEKIGPQFQFEPDKFNFSFDFSDK